MVLRLRAVDTSLLDGYGGCVLPDVRQGIYSLSSLKGAVFVGFVV